ncbi:hypothetical protein [Paracoccus liaowanqingii]|nr:hypothetical protein [Paracoccus liaowanqingii]
MEIPEIWCFLFIAILILVMKTSVEKNYVRDWLLWPGKNNYSKEGGND